MERLLDLSEVLALTGLSPTTITRLEKKGEFPSRRRIAQRRIAWIASEVQNWLFARELCSQQKGAGDA